jgi:hypothetical protein
MYSQAWDKSYATNKGQYRGYDKYTITYSYTFTNATSPGKPRLPCDVAQASRVIKSSTLGSFCSSLLGYSTPFATVAITATTVVTLHTTVTVTPAANMPGKRGVATPSALATYPASAISSACSLNASPVTKTATVYQTALVTATTVVTDQVTATPTPGACYSLVMQRCGTCLSSSSGGSSQQTCNPADNSQIYWVSDSITVGNTVKIFNLASQAYINFNGFNAYTGLTSGQSPQDQWILGLRQPSTAPDVFYIESAANRGSALDIAGGQCNVGAGLLSYDVGSRTEVNDNQSWKFMPVTCPNDLSHP